MLKPSHDEVVYGLDEWPASERAALTAALVELDAPYRWEPGIVLVVPAAAETDVDRLLDDIEAAEGVDAAVVEDDSAEDGGEEAQTAMVELFVAADRLQHTPWDKSMAADLCRAVDAVTASLPPYGVEPAVWRHVQKRGEALAESASQEIIDDEVVAAGARSLRDLLREYV
jgi:hypothetical protein